MGFFNSSYGPCLFSQKDSDSSVLIIGVYVDDVILVRDGEEVNWFIDKFI